MQALATCLSMPATALAAVPLQASTATLVDQFVAAGSALLGIELDDRDLALPYLALMRKRFTAAQLKAFVSANAPGKARAHAPRRATSAIERQAMLLWLTGYDTDAGGKPVKVVTYSRAAVWAALPFTKPPGWCGGAFGYWADAPATT